MTSQNPLTPLVLAALRAAPAGLSEYQLLKQIEAGGEITDASGDANLDLFRKHFLLMNALYRLRDQLWREEQLWLCISALHIALEPGRSGSGSGGNELPSIESDAALRAYYLDWQQFERSDGAAVTELLATFWRRFQSRDQREAALMTLQLTADVDWPGIRRQYRRLAAQTHPDRGGDTGRFLEIRAAYELLRATPPELKREVRGK